MKIPANPWSGGWGCTTQPNYPEICNPFSEASVTVSASSSPLSPPDMAIPAPISTMAQEFAAARRRVRTKPASVLETAAGTLNEICEVRIDLTHVVQHQNLGKGGRLRLGGLGTLGARRRAVIRKEPEVLGRGK